MPPSRGGAAAPSGALVYDLRIRIFDRRWTSYTFLLYAGGLMALAASVALLGVIQDDHGDGAFAGFSVLFFAGVTIIALGLRQREHPVTAGVFAFVAVSLFGTMVGAFWTWFDCLEESDNDFEGF